jgi:hypothetical protein
VKPIPGVLISQPQVLSEFHLIADMQRGTLNGTLGKDETKIPTVKLAFEDKLEYLQKSAKKKRNLYFC